MTTDSATLREPTASNRTGSKQRKSPVWHTSTPKSVLAAYLAGDEDHGWSAWTEHLATRTQPALPKLLTAGKLSPLQWALPASVDAERLETVLTATTTKASRNREKHLVGELEAWLSEQDPTRTEVQFGFEALAWAYELPQLAERIPAGLWWQLVDQLVEAAQDAAAIDAAEQPLAHQLLAGELPLVLGYLLPELRACHALVKRSRKSLSIGIVAVLDGQGLPHTTNLAVFRSLLACWTRCGAIGKTVKGGIWKKDAEHQFEWAIRQAIRMTRPDGSQIFDTQLAHPNTKHLFAAALEVVGDRDDRSIAAENLPRKWTKHLNKPKSVARLPNPSFNSTWADISVLRADWSRKSPSFTASFAGDTFAAEFANQAQILSSGPWQTEISHAGTNLKPDGEWEELCWVSDKDVDYLELQLRWTGGVTMQRQMLLARKDQFLLVADALLAEKSGPWEYRQAWPLADGIVYAGEQDTREGYLKQHNRKRALVIPPALPEWRVDRRIGSLGLNASGLEMRLSATGTALYAPLVIDLNPDRMTRDRTWRQLTVAEHLQVLPTDTAVGYRIQLGNKQWLIYRSLAAPRNRTVLSHNLISEFLVARFRRDGEFETLLEIEP